MMPDMRNLIQFVVGRNEMEAAYHLNSSVITFVYDGRIDETTFRFFSNCARSDSENERKWVCFASSSFIFLSGYC